MIGRTLAHYRITGELGAGGMGVVYRAEDTRLGRQVALKFVASDFAHDQQALLRLRSEARAASALNHPNICTIYDIGEDDGRPFIVMELMNGQSLRDRLNSGPLKTAQVVDVGMEVADALQAAHAKGIIHRDIKPGNIFLTERGHVKILDFGLAKLAHTITTATTADPAPHTSATGVTLGTPAYMSPEQASGEPIDHRTDLFSVGVVLYECATGHHPFPGKTSAMILAGILDRAPAPARVYNPDLPVRLTEIISNCLEKDRELRYQSAADLRADLKRLRRDLGSGAVPPLPRADGDRSSSARGEPAEPVTPAVEPVTPVASSGPVTGARPGSHAWWIAAGSVILAAAVVAVVLLWPSGARQPSPQPLPSSTVVQPEAQAPLPAPPTVSTDRLMTLATASLSAGNYRAALASAREVLALEANHPGAAKIRDQATAMLQRFDNEIADARRRLNARDLDGATRALERARAIDPASPSLAELNGRLIEALRVRQSPPAPERTTAAPDPQPIGPPVQAPSFPPPVVPRAVDVPPPPAAPVQPQPAPEPAPPPAAAAPPERSAPSPAALAEKEDAAIRQVIASYGKAIEAKDIRLFRTLKPNLTPEEERRLQEGFRAVRSQRVNLSVISIERAGDKATAVIRRRDEIEAGGRQQTTESKQVLSLARTDAGWVIVDIR